MSVPISTFRAELKKWAERVRNGEEIVVTDRGIPVMRVVSPDMPSNYERLVAEGVLRPARQPKRPAHEHGPGVKLRGTGKTLSEIVVDQRGD